MGEEQLEAATLYKPVGCPECEDSGYKGRAGVHEALAFTPESRKLIIAAGESVDEEAIRVEARAQGMMTLRQSGLVRAAAGETTLEAVLAATTMDE